MPDRKIYNQTELRSQYAYLIVQWLKLNFELSVKGKDPLDLDSWLDREFLGNVDIETANLLDQLGSMGYLSYIPVTEDDYKNFDMDE